MYKCMCGRYGSQLRQLFFTTSGKLLVYKNVQVSCSVYVHECVYVQIVTVTLQSSKKEQLLRDSSVTEDHKSDRVDTVSFPCPQLGQLQTWHHVVVTVAKTLRQKSRVSLFVDGLPLGVQKMAYIRPVVVLEGLSYDSTPYLINAHIGTHVSQRHVSNLLIRYCEL